MNREWQRILAFNNQYFPGWRKTKPVFYSNALAGETGEVCNAIKKLMGGGTNKEYMDAEIVGLEAVDVFIYLVLLLENLDINWTGFQNLFDFKMRILKRRMEDQK